MVEGKFLQFLYKQIISRLLVQRESVAGFRIENENERDYSFEGERVYKSKEQTVKQVEQASGNLYLKPWRMADTGDHGGTA